MCCITSFSLLVTTSLTLFPFKEHFNFGKAGKCQRESSMTNKWIVGHTDWLSKPKIVSQTAHSAAETLNNSCIFSKFLSKTNLIVYQQGVQWLMYRLFLLPWTKKFTLYSKYSEYIIRQMLPTTLCVIELLRKKFPERVFSRSKDQNWPPRSCDWQFSLRIYDITNKTKNNF